MNFTLTKDGRLGIFHLHERKLDSTIEAEIKSELLILCQEPIDVLILDLDEVEFCDSSGLSALLLAERQMRDRGGVLIVDRKGKIRSLVEIAKVGHVLPVFESLDSARAAVEE